VISSSTDVTYYERSATYVVDGITYGAGYPARNQLIPISGSFWIAGATSQAVNILFICGGI
jgi:hypothetical protein